MLLCEGGLQLGVAVEETSLANTLKRLRHDIWENPKSSIRIADYVPTKDPVNQELF